MTLKKPLFFSLPTFLSLFDTHMRIPTTTVVQSSRTQSKTKLIIFSKIINSASSSKSQESSHVQIRKSSQSFQHQTLLDHFYNAHWYNPRAHFYHFKFTLPQLYPLYPVLQISLKQAAQNWVLLKSRCI